MRIWILLNSSGGIPISVQDKIMEKIMDKELISVQMESFWKKKELKYIVEILSFWIRSWNALLLSWIKVFHWEENFVKTGLRITFLIVSILVWNEILKCLWLLGLCTNSWFYPASILIWKIKTFMITLRCTFSKIYSGNSRNFFIGALLSYKES